MLVIAAASPMIVNAQSAEPPRPPQDFPYEVKLVDAELEQGETQIRQMWALSGFDPSEFGGDDSDCDLQELDNVRWTDEIGAPDEDCKIVFEWSLKNGDETLASAMYAMEPEEETIGQKAEWIRFNFEQTSGRVRFVGSMWRLPKGWNAHQMAIDLAADWQEKNVEEWSVVGLSPTDPWIQAMWQDAESQFDSAGAVVAEPTATEPVVEPTDWTKVCPVPADGKELDVAGSEAAGTCTYADLKAEEPAGTKTDWTKVCPVPADGKELDVAGSEAAGTCTYADLKAEEPAGTKTDGMPWWGWVLIIIVAVSLLIWLLTRRQPSDEDKAKADKAAADAAAKKAAEDKAKADKAAADAAAKKASKVTVEIDEIPPA